MNEVQRVDRSFNRRLQETRKRHFWLPKTLRLSLLNRNNKGIVFLTRRYRSTCIVFRPKINIKSAPSTPRKKLKFAPKLTSLFKPTDPPSSGKLCLKGDHSERRALHFNTSNGQKEASRLPCVNSPFPNAAGSSESMCCGFACLRLDMVQPSVSESCKHAQK